MMTIWFVLLTCSRSQLGQFLDYRQKIYQNVLLLSQVGNRAREFSFLLTTSFLCWRTSKNE